jgi:signal transduction histidine kinase
LVIGFILLNRQIAKQIWRPFRNTLEKLKSFDLTTQQTVSFDKTDIEEFAELNQSLQKLIDKNISVYSQQKTFIENASHELQTPLAVLKSKLNLLLQNKNITSEQAELLTAIDLPLSRMTRINKNLLLLAKIENNQFAEIETIELTEIINETLELLIDYTTTKQITIDKNLSEKLTLTCNKTLLEILVNNLLINAIIHNTEQGKIQISFSDKTLTVSNTGKTPLNNEKLFERFAVSSSQTTNSGLGLAIVKEICNRYQWKINYAFENNFHSFAVKF